MARLRLGKTFLDTRPSTRCSVSRSMVIATLTLLMDPSPWYDNISYHRKRPGDPARCASDSLDKGLPKKPRIPWNNTDTFVTGSPRGISRLRSRLPDRA